MPRTSPYRVRNALQDGRDPRTVVTAEECGIVAAVEWGSRSGPGITPGMAYEAQRTAWASWQRDECAKAGRFWNLLADEHAASRPADPAHRAGAGRADQGRRPAAPAAPALPPRAELAGVPVILLDADLDPVIARKFWPQIEVVEIPVQQHAHIVQVIDRSCSMRFLLGGGEGDQQRADRRLARAGAVRRPGARRWRAVRLLQGCARRA